MQLIRKEKRLLLVGTHEGESEAELILVPFDFVCVCVLSARTSCRLQSIKGSLCAVWIPIRGFRTRLHERGAVLCCGEGLAQGSDVAGSGGLVGRWVDVTGPASPCAPLPALPFHREPRAPGHSQGRTRCPSKTGGNARFATFFLFPSL